MSWIKHITNGPSLLLRIFPLSCFLSFCLIVPVRAELSPEQRSWLQQQGEIVFVSQSAYPPFEFFDTDNNRRGMSIELAQWIATEFGFKAVFHDMPFEEAQKAVLSGEADILTSLFYSDKRSERFDFTEMTWEVPALIFVQAERPDIITIQDLTGKRVAMQRGDYAAEFLQSKFISFQIVPTATFAEAVDKVVAGEADAVIGDEQIVLYHLFSNNLLQRIKSVGEPLYIGKNSMATREGATELIAILNQGLELARERGVFDSINHKWIGTQYHRDDNRLAKYVTPVLFLLAAILTLTLCVLLWNRNLRLAVRRQTEELRSSEEKFRALVETSSDWIWEVNSDLIFTYSSPQVTSILGYTPEEFIGKKIYEIMPAEEAARVAEVAEQWLAGQRSFSALRHRCRTKDGKELVTETSGVPFFDGQGGSAGYRGVTRDISERQRHELERQELAQKLQHAQKLEAIGLMAGGVAHDLNNILSGVVSYPELLIMQLPQDSDMRRPLQTIREAGQRAAEVVADLLTVARGTASVKKVIDLNLLIHDFFISPEWSNLKLRHPEVVTELHLDPDLLHVSCSPIHIRKCIMNLLLNAVEASGISGIISVTTANRYIDRPDAGNNYLNRGEFVQVEVTDCGHGIAEEDRERIFEPFYTKKVLGKSGTGLGLTIVWNTVQEHGGTVMVTSGEQGTTFTLFLPATREQLDEQPDEVAMAALHGKGERILVVDDEKMQREIAGQFLLRLGYQVHTAASGEEAVAAVRDTPVDLILLDMIMDPGLNGLQTFEQILALRPGQKAVIASGFSENELVRNTLRLGAGCFIKKPYSFNQLGLAIKQTLGD